MTETIKDHVLRVKDFMKKANQETPEELIEPTEEVRILRAKLILEEALETIEKGLGVCVSLKTYVNASGVIFEQDVPILEELLSFVVDDEYNAVETLDGLLDLSVVGLAGTSVACGFSTETVEEAVREVDENNLAKFGPGHSIREDGKLIKPPDHKAPDLKAILEKQKNG